MNIESRHRRRKWGQSAWLRALAVLIGAGVIALGPKAFPVKTSAALPTSTPQPFSDTDDARTQRRELVEYIEEQGRPRRVVQVDLESHPKISQFTDIDSSESGYGLNACGLVAAAAALGGDEWVSLVDAIGKAAGKNYGRHI